MPPELKRLLEEIGTSLNALTSVTDPNDPNALGEPWRSELLTIKGQINASLRDLPPTDQVAAANEARYGLETLKNQLLCVQSIINSLGGIVKAKNGEKAQALASVSTQVESAIQAKVTAGEYLTKQAATDLAANARKEGEQAGFERGRLLGDRRSALALAGIPAEVVASAPEDVLLSEEAKFNSARDAAKDRIGKLSGIGLTVASATLKTLPWAAPETFDVQLASFTEVAEAAKKSAGTGQSKNSAGDKPPKTNPLASGPTGSALKMCATNVVV